MLNNTSTEICEPDPDLLYDLLRENELENAWGDDPDLLRDFLLERELDHEIERQAALSLQSQNNGGEPHPMLAAALAYAEQLGWKSFPARMEDGKKYSWLSKEHAPGGENWGMTNDPEQLRRNFTKRKWRDICGVGIPTGWVNRIFDIEADTKEAHGADGLASLSALEAKYGRLPDTLMAESPTGSPHRIYRHPGQGIKVISRGLPGYPGVDIKGDGGMFVAPPSVRGDGQYKWLNDLPIADAPQWLIDLVVDASGNSNKTNPRQPKPPPADAFNSAKIADAFRHLEVKPLGEGIEPMPPGPPVPFAPVKEGCAWLRHVHETGGADQTEPLWKLALNACVFLKDGENLIHEFSKGYDGYDFKATEAKFERARQDKEGMGLGWPLCQTICDHSSTYCKTCPHLALGKSPLNLGLPQLTPAADLKRFRDFDRYKKPKASLANAVIAIRALGIGARLDLFHHRIDVTYKGDAKTIHEGLLTDDTISAVRSLINNTYKIDCGDNFTLAAIKEVARDNAFDPVLDMLDDFQAKWDGTKRLDTWVIDYLGCEDTPLHRATGRLALIAACRRARVPGCKFDQIIIEEGPEGKNKSTSIRVLAGDENFSDQSIIGADAKEVQEQLDGIWMHENADLAGMRKVEVEKVKAFARRQVDRARPAYGRVREDRPRRSIEWGTTNEDTYMLSQTGNRCFWPLKTDKVDIEALIRDREQLLGEAATYEAAGASIVLDEKLWGAARDAQELRRVADPWEDILKDTNGKNGWGSATNLIHKSDDGFDRVASASVLKHVLGIPEAQQNSACGQRLALAMKHAGWERNRSGRVTINGQSVRGYIRQAPPRTEAELEVETAATALTQARFTAFKQWELEQAIKARAETRMANQLAAKDSEP